MICWAIEDCASYTHMGMSSNSLVAADRALSLGPECYTGHTGSSRPPFQLYSHPGCLGVPVQEHTARMIY